MEVCRILKVLNEPFVLVANLFRKVMVEELDLDAVVAEVVDALAVDSGLGSGMPTNTRAMPFSTTR